MTNLVDKISDAHKFLNVLTWKKLVQLMAFVFIMGLTWATYENRTTIYGFISQKRLDTSASQTRELSKPTKIQINVVAEKSDLVAGVTVMIADFQKNQRVTVYAYVNDAHPELKKEYQDFIDSSIGNVPLFSDNVEDNKRLVALINGEFMCNPYEGTLGQRLIPSTGQYIKYACSNGIPASYGRFTGIITLYLTRQPKPDEVEQIRITTKNLASLIFDNDLSK